MKPFRESVSPTATCAIYLKHIYGYILTSSNTNLIGFNQRCRGSPGYWGVEFNSSDHKRLNTDGEAKPNL